MSAGCYLCRPDDPHADEEAYIACDRHYWENPVYIVEDTGGCTCDVCPTFVAPPTPQPATCAHTCCTRRTDPHHLHDTPPERCPACADDRVLAATQDLADRYGDE